MKEILFKTNEQKVLAFILSHPGKQFLEKEIREATGLSRSGVNYAMRNLAKKKLLEQNVRGRVNFYWADLSSPVLRQLKILQNLIELSSLLEAVKKVCRKIILYGSAASGTNTDESDLDIFVLADHPEKVFKIFNSSPLREKIQTVVKSPLEYVDLEKKDHAFFEQVNRGIVLWERNDGS